MSANQITTPEFRFTLPDGTWSRESSSSEHTFRCDNREEIIVSVLTPKRPILPAELQSAVVRLFRARVDAVLQLAGKSCQFEPVTCLEKPGRIDAGIFGHDAANGVWMQHCVIGTLQRLVTISYYDYSRAPNADQFRSRVSQFFSNINL